MPQKVNPIPENSGAEKLRQASQLHSLSVMKRTGLNIFAIVPLLTITAAMSPAQNIYKESRKGSSEIEGKGAHGSNERAKKKLKLTKEPHAYLSV